LLLAVCFTLAGCFSSVEATTKEEKVEPKPPNMVLILTDDLALEDVNADTLKHFAVPAGPPSCAASTPTTTTSFTTSRRSGVPSGFASLVATGLRWLPG
jgi:hypothetical protein